MKIILIFFCFFCCFINASIAQNNTLKAKDALKKELSLIKRVTKSANSATSKRIKSKNREIANHNSSTEPMVSVQPKVEQVVEEKRVKNPTQPQITVEPQPEPIRQFIEKDSYGNYLIINAVMNGSNKEQEIKDLISKGARINVKDQLGNTPLILAIIQKTPQSIISLLADNETVNLANDIGETPLKIALKQKNNQLVEFLMSKNVNSAGAFNDKIWFAIEKNKTDLIQNIIDNKGNLNQVKKGETPLTYAIKNNKGALVNMLIRGKANPVFANTDGDTPLALALKGNNISLFKQLLQINPSVLNQSDKYGYAALNLAFMYGSERLAKELINNGAMFGSVMQAKNITPLMLAIEYNKPSFYFDYMSDGRINEISTFGKSALVLAIEKGDSGLVNQLIANGANIHNQNHVGNTPIGYAVAYNQMTILMKLINEGADINRPNKYGSTPLMEAAYYNYPDMARVLRQYNANANYRDMYGLTAKQIAEHFKNNEVLTYLY